MVLEKPAPYITNDVNHYALHLVGSFVRKYSFISFLSAKPQGLKWIIVEKAYLHNDKWPLLKYSMNENRSNNDCRFNDTSRRRKENLRSTRGFKSTSHSLHLSDSPFMTHKSIINTVTSLCQHFHIIKMCFKTPSNFMTLFLSISYQPIKNNRKKSILEKQFDFSRLVQEAFSQRSV